MKIILTISILFSNLIFSQVTVPSDYLKIPDTLRYKNDLYRFIIPSQKYKYWKVMRKDDTMEEKLMYENKVTKSLKCAKTNSPEKGFFIECLPGWCFTYITAYKNKMPKYFTSEKELKDFIGYVDNLPEALLIARTYNLLFDYKNPIGGSFKMDKDFFYLYLAKFENCPVNREAFYVKINRKTGVLEYESKGIYYKTNDCFVS
ncbi:hypothetical protein RAH57_17260 [Chryseobacterium sp. CKR4-1]|uniref:hypothetical protein n=1 Tax=Chryseobacterium sp. CKR4-1 TaxID=3068896 RepID=UPI002796AF1F|nr:hypothetical protein [Chryseobacterium sp. CKR4-1]MDQ1805743.1 hypothetical protein [Chryseobacterium sp. CKR4-1]